jgi:predicted TIM-barrel fold metal-dependent hydrolase
MGGEPLVDAHVHLHTDPAAGRQAKDRYVIWEYGDDPGVTFSASAGDVSTLASVYEKAGFDRAIVLHLFDTALAREQAATAARLGAADATAAAAEAMRASNRWIAGVVRANPVAEVLISVDPAALPPQAITAHLAELAAAGVLGVKLHPVFHSFAPGDPRLHPMYELCADAGLIVLAHSGPGPAGVAGSAGAAGSARPSDFVPVLRKWPHLRLVLAHLGGASWHETAAVAADFPQLMFDLSEIIEWTGAPHAPSAAQLSALIRRIGADRVMLGSDFPRYDPLRTADRVAGLPGLSTAERAAILGGTAMRVFGLAR